VKTKLSIVIENSNSTVKNILHYFNFLMIAMYVTLGLLFLFTQVAIEILPEHRQAMGVVFIVYSVIRATLLIRKIKKTSEQNYHHKAHLE
jgi:heme A synthase